jgi:3-phosphoshikimate 1-carboxyvinyltransferase
LNLHPSLAQPLRARPSPVLTGRIMVPGDKSISHRSLMLGAIAIGETVINGLLEAEDVIHTANAMRELGAEIEEGQGQWRVRGVGVGGFAEPSGPLDFGNSGTGVRLAMGLLASSPITAGLTGDASLSRRPMGRVMAPLEKIGARFEAADDGRLPLKIHGARDSVPITYRLPVASAQVKSAVLLAGLNVAGRTTVIEPVATRDHTERMLKAFGAKIKVEQQEGARAISLTGQEELSSQRILVPADPSSAAFAIVAGLVTRSSEITIENVMLNPTRSGLIETLIEMGGQLTITNRHEAGGETVGDVTAYSSRLRGVRVPAHRAASMIDEYPILAVAAAFAEGVTRMEGLEELRVKESDRLAAVAEGLAANGVKVAAGADWLEVTGGKVAGGGAVRTHLDHRIAMSFLVMGLAAEEAVTVDDAAMIATSFPNFRQLFTALGARIDAPGDK